MTENCELLINTIQNEPSIWDATVNASEVEKELAWIRIGDVVGCQKV